MKARLLTSGTGVPKPPISVTPLTQDQTNEIVKQLLNGEGAEIYGSIDPETGKIQVLYKASPAAACLILTNIVEQLSKKGIPHQLIKESVEIGLDHRSRR